MKRKVLMSMAAAFAMAVRAVPARADIGLGMRFGDVILENVQMGRTYDLRDVAHVPCGVENRGDADEDVMLEFVRPSASYVSKDYEVIPDPDWFKSVPVKMHIAAHSVGYFDILLNVPDDPKLKGHHYQVTARAKIVREGLLNVAVENRIRFSIGPGPESIQREKKKKAMQQLDFDVTPSEMYVREVPVGHEYNVRKETKKSIRVANFSGDALSVLMSIEKWDANYPLPDGYEPIPEPGWIRMEKSTVSVEGDAIGQANLIVKVPNDAKWKGKKYAAMVRTGLTTGFWLDAPVKVYLETQP